MATITRNRIPDDLIQPFQLETNTARGRLIRLGPLVDQVLERHDYPDPVAMLLGEMLGLAALVSAALKFDGVFTVQAKGDGPVRTLLADITTDGDMRGYAQFDEDRLNAVLGNQDTESWLGSPVPRLLGAGHLAFTVDQGPETARFQGIVELAGATLADCAQAYIRQSEQLQAAVVLTAGQVADSAGALGWRVGGLMVQRLPGEGRSLLSGEIADDDAEDDWVRAVALTGSSTRDELLDPSLHPHDFLYRLFHEEGVRVFDPASVVMRCRCTEQKVTNMLRSFPRSEIEDLTIDDVVVVTCEFCGIAYKFDQHALDDVYAT